MGMTPGYGISSGGVKYLMPMNEYGEFEEDTPAHLRIMDHMSAVNAYEAGKFRDPGTIQDMSNNNRAWANSRRKMGQAVKMSGDSKRYRAAIKNLKREFELKKGRGDRITEADMRRMYDLQDRLEENQTAMGHFYNKGSRTAALSRSLDSKHLRSRGRR
jgi:hypothetical protein